MPPRWPRKPDRNDPAYRRLDDRMNFAMHVAIFAATNSGMWFVSIVKAEPWAWVTWITFVWAIALVLHAVYIFAIANYSNAPTASSSQKSS
jgi:hypothetical protein